ncbi:NAD(P)/FAD-dependent oxidoreductase [Nitratireductor kimnyeongensis]|uniref:NAD(P)/FAD-dependent oxidoreductase n=1 Tax=Nitratireductor kimnyeongensis TaxID=430679 RepID=A0ABW0T551_9HYPH|nr:FAD-dependent oxidoreductase [Nitratireductor kimnyeongensis]QZZ37497.1 FAD-dependent oxidoreductase [Nitratireductor kimnyeongensis]
MDDHIIIIGAGHGGVQAAASLREEGYEGRLTLVSGDPELPYHKPPLSKAFLKAIDAEPQILRAQAFYDTNRIELQKGVRVADIDPAGQTLRLEEGGQLVWTGLLLATGAEPRRLSVPGADLSGVFYLRDCADARNLRDAFSRANSVVVIGGGFIGLEVAATAAMAGKGVTVVEAADRILGRAVSQPVAAHMHAYHEGLGVTIFTGTDVERLDGTEGTVRSVITKDGQILPADMVLVGIGAKPNIALAEAAGLVCDNGIRVDASCRTSARNIHGIGDCVSFPHVASGRVLRLESVQNATDQARIAAKSMLGKPAVHDAVAWFWSDQGERKLQMAGLPFDVDREIIAGDAESGAFGVYLYAGDRLVAVETVNRPGEHMMARRMLAAGFSPTAEAVLEGPAALKSAMLAGGR